MNYIVLDIIHFNLRYKIYNDRFIEVRYINNQLRYYECCGKKNYCLTKFQVKWLVQNNRIIRKDKLKIKNYLKNGTKKK